MSAIVFEAAGALWRMRIPRASEMARAGLRPLLLVPPPGGDRPAAPGELPAQFAEMMEQAEALTCACLTGTCALDEGAVWRDIRATTDDAQHAPADGVIFVAYVPEDVIAKIMEHLNRARTEATEALKSFRGQ